MDFDSWTFESPLDWRNRLHQQWLGVSHVQMHEPHHGQRRVHPFDGGVNLTQVVVSVGGDMHVVSGGVWIRHRLESRFLFFIFQSGQVISFDDLHSGVLVDQVGDQVHGNKGNSDVEDGVFVFHIQSFGKLVH